MAPGETLVALPEGIILNVLLRRRNPTPHMNFMPPEILIFDEQAILASLEATPPDWIALVHKDTSEYGPRFFGRDYARRLAAFVRRDYRRVGRTGDVPFEPEARYGIELWRRTISSDDAG
jgi:hypothetical protein